DFFHELRESRKTNEKEFDVAFEFLIAMYFLHADPGSHGILYHATNFNRIERHAEQIHDFGEYYRGERLPHGGFTAAIRAVLGFSDESFSRDLLEVLDHMIGELDEREAGILKARF